MNIERFRRLLLSPNKVVLTVTITPELAEEMIKLNGENREIRPAIVSKYARDMLAGRWKLTHQGLLFTSAGKLADGQHRILAVIHSRVTIRSLVCFGWEDATIGSVDSGKGRTNAQTLRILGWDMASELAVASLRAMLVGSNRREYCSMSVGQEEEEWCKHEDAIAFAMKHLGKGCSIAGVVTSTLIGVVARAWYTCDRAKLAEFCREMIEQDFRPKTYTLLLFKSLIVNKPARGRRYWLIERALRGYLDGEKSSCLHPAKSELFPIPGDEGF